MSWLKYLLKTLMFLLMCTVKRVSRLYKLKTYRSLTIIITVYVVTFCVVLPFLCHDLPLTKYYAQWKDPKDIIERAENLNRVNADNAEKRLARLPKESTKRTYEQAMKEQRLRFVIAVQTIPRSGLGETSPGYLTQVMVALHDVLEQERRLSETALFMCHTPRPRDKEHVEAIALSEYFPMVVQRSPPGFDQDLYEQEKQAYLYCLREAHKLIPDYVIILEDDTLPHTNFYSTLDYVLKHKVESRILRGELLRSDNVDWSWMKLNLPNNLMKYERNYYFALEWISISLIGSTLTTIFFVSLYRMNLNRQKVSVLLLFLVWFVYCMLITLVLGRSYITLPITMSDTLYNLGPGTSCCTQAVLFPQKHLPDIMHYLETIKLSRKTPLDFALEDYRTKRNLRQFLINPNLCTHIGVISSLHGLPNHGVAENYLFAMKNLKNQLPTWFGQ